MKKKVWAILLVTIGIMLTGCSVAPFNTKAKVSYDTAAIVKEIDVTTNRLDYTIPVISENAVSAELKDLIFEKTTDNVNWTKFSVSFDAVSIAANAKTSFIVKPFKGMTDGDLGGIKAIRYKVILKDDNENEITMDTILVDTYVKLPEVSETKVTTVAGQPPTIPSGFSYELKSNFVIALKWKQNPESNILNYIVEESSDGINFTPIATPKVNAYVVNKKKADEAKTYTYRIRAKNSETDETKTTSAATEPVSVIILYTDKIAAPTNLVAQPGAESVTLSWLPPKETKDGYRIAGYLVKYGDSFVKLNSDSAERAFAKAENIKIDGIKGQYYFTVKAIGGEGFLNKEVKGEEGKESDPVSAYIYLSSATVPVLKQQEVETDPSVDGVIVKWKDTYDDKIKGGYIVLRALETDEADKYSKVGTIKKGDTAFYDATNKVYKFPDSTATESGTYYYKICGYDDNENNMGQPSGAKIAVVTPTPAPPDAINVIGNIPFSRKIICTWVDSASSGIAGYKVYVSRTADGKYYYMGTTGDTNMILDAQDYREVRKFEAEGSVVQTMSDGTVTPITDKNQIGHIVVPGWTLDGSGGRQSIPGDRIMYYTNMERPDGKIEQRLQFIDLPDPFTSSNSEGERRREFYFKLSRINKTGKESSLTGYKRIDLIAPKENYLDVRVGVKKTEVVPSTPTTPKGTRFFLGMSCSNLGLLANRYVMYLSKSIYPFIKDFDELKWIDVNYNNVVDEHEWFKTSSFDAGSPITDAPVIETKEFTGTFGWSDTQVVYEGEYQDFVYFMVANDSSLNQNGLFDFADYWYDESGLQIDKYSSKGVLAANQKIKLPKYLYTGPGEINMTGTHEYTVYSTKSGGIEAAFINLGDDKTPARYPFFLGYIGGPIEAGYGWKHIRLYGPDKP